MELKNWKLKQLGNKVKIIHPDSIEFRSSIIDILDLPTKVTDGRRSETAIDWHAMRVKYSFFFDYVGNEDIEFKFMSSELSKYKEIIVTYGFDEPTVSIPVEDFFKEWEDIFASTIWCSLLFSPDYSLIMEISRDYYLYSNFQI